MAKRMRRAITVTAVAAGVAGGALLATGAATAGPATCTQTDVDTALVPGEPGAGQRYGYVVFTARDGVECSLEGAQPLTLTGAPNVSVVADQAPAPVVVVSGGNAASMELHWTGVEAPERQQVPDAVTITAPTSDRANVTFPWSLGPVDASAEAHTLRVGPVTPNQSDVAVPGQDGG